MSLLLILLILLLLFGGGGYYGRRAGWGRQEFVRLLALELIVILAIWVVNELLLPPLPMPAGVPSIMR